MGRPQMLSFVNNFNFNWMNNYIYADDAAPVLPKGTIIHVTAWHDNTSANPNNRIPINGWVTATGRSMRWPNAWVNVTYISDEDYAAWASKHPKSRGMGARAAANP